MDLRNGCLAKNLQNNTLEHPPRELAHLWKSWIRQWIQYDALTDWWQLQACKRGKRGKHFRGPLTKSWIASVTGVGQQWIPKYCWKVPNFMYSIFISIGCAPISVQFLSFSCNFSANILPNNRLTPQPLGLASPSVWEILDLPLMSVASCNSLEFFRNRAELSLNSANSGNLINHWSMNWAQFKDPVSTCLAGTVVPSWSLTQDRGRSRINHRRGANPLGEGQQHTILPNFPKKLHEIENFLGRRGCTGGTPWDPPLQEVAVLQVRTLLL